MKLLHIVSYLFSGVILINCGGGGSMPPTTTTPPNYANFVGKTDGNSSLQGAGIRSNNSSGQLDTVTLTGTYSAATDDLTLNDGTHSFVTTAGGVNAAGVYTGTSGSSLSPNRALDTTGYEYLRHGTLSYSTHTVNGVYGIATDMNDVNNGAQATFTGQAVGTVVGPTNGFDLTNGTSTVAANFSTNTVNVTLNGFTSTNQATGAAEAAPVDQISITSMVISGSGFKGGTVTLSKSGTTVTPTGANTSQNVSGIFAGFDAATSTPDEVGGVLLIQGDNGIVTGAFVAD